MLKLAPQKQNINLSWPGTQGYKKENFVSFESNSELTSEGEGIFNSTFKVKIFCHMVFSKTSVLSQNDQPSCPVPNYSNKKIIYS